METDLGSEQSCQFFRKACMLIFFVDFFKRWLTPLRVDFDMETDLGSE